MKQDITTIEQRLEVILKSQVLLKKRRRSELIYELRILEDFLIMVGELKEPTLPPPRKR